MLTRRQALFATLAGTLSGKTQPGVPAGLWPVMLTPFRADKSLDWKACLGFMNERDTAQKLFVINWDLRQAMKRVGMSTIPIEPAATAASTAVAGGDDSAEDAEVERPGTPSEVPPVSAADE